VSQDSKPMKIDLYPAIRLILHEFLNKIYDTKIIPKQWKVSRTIPLFKKGDRNNVKNYRPIANLCSIAKIFEKLILKRLNEFEIDFNINITGR